MAARADELVKEINISRYDLTQKRYLRGKAISKA